jgi:hypothetical protein
MTTQKQYEKIKDIARKKTITPQDLEELRFLEIDMSEQQAKALDYENIKEVILERVIN